MHFTVRKTSKSQGPLVPNVKNLCNRSQENRYKHTYLTSQKEPIFFSSNPFYGRVMADAQAQMLRNTINDFATVVNVGKVLLFCIINVLMPLVVQGSTQILASGNVITSFVTYLKGQVEMVAIMQFFDSQIECSTLN